MIYLPLWNFYGLDLHNLHAFHNYCPEWPVPYDRPANLCGDILNRPMIYPPLLYWLMGWLRGTLLTEAALYWSFAIILFTFLGTWLVSIPEAERNPDRSLPRWIWMLWILLLLQLPMAYAVERGNVDAAVIPVYCLGTFLYWRRKYFWAGFFIATSCWMKVYPAVPSLLILSALVLDPELRKQALRPFFSGFITGGMAWAILLFPDSYRYVFEVLPRLTRDPGGYGTSSHTLYNGTTGMLVKIPLLIAWAVFFTRALRRDPILIFTAGLAISTFFQNLSNDYNLITAYPFLFVVMHRLLRPRMNFADFAVLLLTFAAFVLDRTPMELVFHNRGALFTQLVWFLVFPLSMMKRIDKGTSSEGNLIPR